MTIAIVATFITGVFASTPITGVFASSASQVLNVFVTNFPKTHVGQDVNSLVTLRCQNFDAIALQPFCTRSHSDGTLPENFTVPVGKVLIVTDLSWSATFAPNSTGSFFLQLREYQTNHHSQVFVSYQAADASGIAAKQEHLTTGFVVSSGPTIEAISGNNLLVMLYGYLVTTG